MHHPKSITVTIAVVILSLSYHPPFIVDFPIRPQFSLLQKTPSHPSLAQIPRRTSAFSMLCSEDELSERAEHFQPLRKQREESQQGERHPKKWGKTWKNGI